MNLWIRIIILILCICIGLYILNYVENFSRMEFTKNMFLGKTEGMSNQYTTDNADEYISGGSITTNYTEIAHTTIVAVPDHKGLSEFNFGTSKSSKIPNIIWTFWEGPQNNVVKLCIDSWKKHNPDYEIYILTKKNYKKYIYSVADLDIDIEKMKHSGDFVARFADYVRCIVLSQHGGFWIDASIICHAPLSWVHATQNKTGAELIGYYIHKGTYLEFMQTSPMIENWFFACVPGSLFMQDWCEEFFRTDEYDTIKEYLDDVKEQGVHFNNIHNLASPEYLTMHISAQKILQQPTDGHQYNLYLFSCCAGPFAYLHDHDWNSAVAVHELVNTTTYENYYKYPLIKLRGSERTVLEQYDDSSRQRAFDN
jgi:mannosyltransferase OCH1-like enzyme